MLRSVTGVGRKLPGLGRDSALRKGVKTLTVAETSSSTPTDQTPVRCGLEVAGFYR